MLRQRDSSTLLCLAGNDGWLERGRVRAVREPPLRGVGRWNDGQGDGSPHPRGQREGRGREGVLRQRDSSTPLCFAGNDGWLERGRGRAVREPPLRGVGRWNDGQGDGSPHPRGQREGRGREGVLRQRDSSTLLCLAGNDGWLERGRVGTVREPPLRGVGRWNDGQGDGSPHPRGQREGRGREGVLRQRDSSTPLCFARNDGWLERGTGGSRTRRDGRFAGGRGC